MKSLYLFVNLFSLLPTLLFSFHPKIRFDKQWKWALPAIMIVAIIFVLWDMYYTHLKVWGFNPKYLLGYYIGNLPIEEVMFFICIPYACLFTYFCLHKFVQSKLQQKHEHLITIVLIASLLTVSLIFISNLYTGVTFLLLGLTLILLQFVLKADWLGKFYVAYLILLLPFTIVNGILTGTGIDEEVVWYNPAENVGIRLLTIPIEDIFYGMLMLLSSISLYELLIKRARFQENI